jgi:hypothetical protein
MAASESSNACFVVEVQRARSLNGNDVCIASNRDASNHKSFAKPLDFTQNGVGLL